MSLPALPNVPAAGSRKAAGLYHWFGLPSTMGPVKFGFRETRSGFRVSPSAD
jgi:hypothetical protein